MRHACRGVAHRDGLAARIQMGVMRLGLRVVCRDGLEACITIGVMCLGWRGVRRFCLAWQACGVSCVVL